MDGYYILSKLIIKGKDVKIKIKKNEFCINIKFQTI